jgi:hypothetical protein
VNGSELKDTLAMLAVGRGTHGARLARMQRTMTANEDAMRECTLPSGSKRVALTEAMTIAQTPKGKRYAQCIICGQAMSTEKGSTHPAFPTLLLLLPSVLWSDDETTGTDKATAHRLGYVAGNVALACLACNQWNNAHIKAGDPMTHTADTLANPEFVLLSWEGIGYSRKSDTESQDAAESRERREAARIARGYSD